VGGILANSCKCALRSWADESLYGIMCEGNHQGLPHSGETTLKTWMPHGHGKDWGRACESWTESNYHSSLLLLRDGGLGEWKKWRVPPFLLLPVLNLSPNQDALIIYSEPLWNTDVAGIEYSSLYLVNVMELSSYPRVDLTLRVCYRLLKWW
jgi:hypothetical protein